MILDDLKLYNPRLYWDSVARGKIPYSSAGGTTWAVPTSPMLEGFLSGPKSPDPNSMPMPSSEYDTPTRLAESGTYPKPFRGGQQYLNNAGTTNLGPYAALIGFVDCTGSGCTDNSCCSDSNKEEGLKPARLWGRWGVATSGPNSGQGAFFPQNWHDNDDATYNADYWVNYFGSQDPPQDIDWRLKKDWWDSVNKVTIKTYFMNSGLKCEIEVAQSTFEFGSPEYFAGIDLAVYNDYSFDLLVAMVALAAAMRWL